jgi:hypothetical protein
MVESKKDKKISEKEKFDIKELYTPLSVAKKEIWKRWNDKELRKKVEEFFGDDVPSFLKKKPKAVIARYIASPNYDTKKFLEYSKEIELDPVIYEHVKDKFYAGNTDKYHLCKMFFYNGEGKKGGLKLDTFKVVDFNGQEGKKLKSIKTIWGESLIHFHHNIFKFENKNSKCEMYDVDGWYGRKGRIPEKYYLYYLSLFICHGVLFENFLTNEEEINFTKNVVWKDFKKVYKKFGVRPLIVPIEPLEDENNIYWWCYPQRLRELTEKNKK